MARGRGGGEAVRIRDHLANTRTLLAWFRSGLLLAAIGFAVTKLHVVEGVAGHSSQLGVTVVGLGMLVMGSSLGRFLQHRNDIEHSELRPRPAFDALLLVAAAASGAAIIYLVAR